MSRQVVTGPQCWSAAVLPLTSGAQTARKRQRSAKRAAPQSMFQASKDPIQGSLPLHPRSSLWPPGDPLQPSSSLVSPHCCLTPPPKRLTTLLRLRQANWLRRGAAAAVKFNVTLLHVRTVHSAFEALVHRGFDKDFTGRFYSCKLLAWTERQL